MLCLSVMQPASTGSCQLLSLPPAHSSRWKVKLKWDKERCCIEEKSAWFGSILMKKEMVTKSCIGFVSKSWHITARPE